MFTRYAPIQSDWGIQVKIEEPLHNDVFEFLVKIKQKEKSQTYSDLSSCKRIKSSYALRRFHTPTHDGLRLLVHIRLFGVLESINTTSKMPL